MIGKVLKKFASQNNLTVAHGVVYGSYQGYLVTMSEDSSANIKYLAVAVRPENEEQATALREFLEKEEWKKLYRLTAAEYKNAYIRLTFGGAYGLAKKMTEFAALLTLKLAELSVPAMQRCSYCGEEYNGSMPATVLANGVALYMHDSCVERINTEAEQMHEESKKGGSFALGTVGALLGAIVGAIPWAIAYYFGWFVGIFGFLIGFASQKGYELFHGKKTRLKALVILVFTVFGVIFANVAAVVLSLYLDPEITLTLPQCVELFRVVCETNDEAMRSVIADIVLGLVFAMIGIYSVIRDVFRDSSKNKGKVIRL